MVLFLALYICYRCNHPFMQFASYAAVVMEGALMGSVSVVLAIAMELMLVVSCMINHANCLVYMV